MDKTSKIRLLQHKRVQPAKIIMALAGLKYSNLAPKVPVQHSHLYKKIIFSIANCLTGISMSGIQFPTVHLCLLAWLR